MEAPRQDTILETLEELEVMRETLRFEEKISSAEYNRLYVMHADIKILLNMAFRFTISLAAKTVEMEGK